MILAPTVFSAATGLLALAALLYGVSLAMSLSGHARTRFALQGAWGLHALALGVQALWSPLQFGFAPALTWTMCLVVAVYGWETRRWPRLPSAAVLSLLALASVVLAWLYPGRVIEAQHDGWLWLHLLLAVAAYGTLCAAVLYAAWAHKAEQRLRNPRQVGNGASDMGLPLLFLEKITFRYVTVAWLLLLTTIALGLWHFGWQWSHKSVFSIAAAAVLSVLVVGRQRLGWRGKVAYRALYVGALLCLLSYVGSRFVIDVLLQRGA